MTAGSIKQPLPADTEERLAQFTDLLATAIANAESRAGLARLGEEQATPTSCGPPWAEAVIPGCAASARKRSSCTAATTRSFPRQCPPPCERDPSCERWRSCPEPATCCCCWLDEPTAVARSRRFSRPDNVRAGPPLGRPALGGGRRNPVAMRPPVRLVPKSRRSAAISA